MSDPTGGWPAAGPEGRSGQAGGDPYGGTYYYPPGQTPGARAPNGSGGTPQRRPLTPQHFIWVAVALLVLVLLIHAHRITRIDVILFCCLIPSIILHEVAHGWVALAFGDDTAKRAHRLTLNPIAHIDVVGTIIVPIIMIWSGFGFFGYAKPVPVNVSKLRSPRNQGVLVSLAGPATNVVLAVLSAVAFHLFGGIHAFDASGQPRLWAEVLVYLGLVNVWLAVFNMIPIPPLDGSVLIERLLPASWWPRYLNVRRYTMPVVLVAIVLASFVHVGNTTLIGHLADSVENWWFNLLTSH